MDQSDYELENLVAATLVLHHQRFSNLCFSCKIVQENTEKIKYSSKNKMSMKHISMNLNTKPTNMAIFHGLPSDEFSGHPSCF
jgi:hypothetical protein